MKIIYTYLITKINTKKKKKIVIPKQYYTFCWKGWIYKFRKKTSYIKIKLKLINITKKNQNRKFWSKKNSWSPKNCMGLSFSSLVRVLGLIIVMGPKFNCCTFYFCLEEKRGKRGGGGFNIGRARGRCRWRGQNHRIPGLLLT